MRSVTRARAGALARLLDSFRDVATVDSAGSSTLVAGVAALGALVDPIDARSVVRGAGPTVAGCTGAPRDVPAGVTFAVDAGAADAGDALAVALAQCDP